MSCAVTSSGGTLKAAPLIYRRLANCTYKQASLIQEYYVRRALDLKAANKVPEPARLLLFEMPPTYTCGRREIGKLSSAEIMHLKTGGQSEFVETKRGGQTTFHGPGQLVAYPILDLRQLGLTARCYVHSLEESIIKTLDIYGIPSKRTENTGVWVSDHEKIAAIGIHVRRRITSHGMALNVLTDPWWFDRIVACGLPDSRTVSMEMLGVKTSVSDVADTFTQCLAQQLGLSTVEQDDNDIPVEQVSEEHIPDEHILTKNC